MTEENSNQSSHILSPRVERHVFSLVTCDKKFVGCPWPRKFFHEIFYLKQNFENPRNFKSSKIIRPTVIPIEATVSIKLQHNVFHDLLNCMYMELAS